MLFRTSTILMLISLLLVAGCGNNTDKNTATDTPEDSLTVALTGIDSTSVLDLLRDGHTVEYRESTIGAFVTEIDSVANPAATSGCTRSTTQSRRPPATDT